VTSEWIFSTAGPSGNTCCGNRKAASRMALRGFDGPARDPPEHGQNQASASTNRAFLRCIDAGAALFRAVGRAQINFFQNGDRVFMRHCGMAATARPSGKYPRRKFPPSEQYSEQITRLFLLTSDSVRRMNAHCTSQSRMHTHLRCSSDGLPTGLHEIRRLQIGVKEIAHRRD